jgi:hypothetical protein
LAKIARRFLNEAATTLHYPIRTIRIDGLSRSYACSRYQRKCPEQDASRAHGLSLRSATIAARTASSGERMPPRCSTA